MATVTVSIGTGGGHDETAVISSVSGAGPTYTVTIAANSSVDGDALWDENTTPRKYLIESGGGTTSLTVRDSDGAGSGPDNSGTSASEIKRYYSTLVLWEAALDNTDLYDASDDAIGECYNDADFTAGIFLVSGSGIGLATVTLTAPSTERHTGIAGTGVIITDLTVPLTLAQDIPILKAQWLEVQSDDPVTVSSNGDGCSVHNLIVHGQTAASQQTEGMIFASGANDWDVNNCIIYDVKHTGANAANVFGFTSRGAAVTAENVQNLTVHDVGSTNAGASGNCICVDVQNDEAAYLVQNVIATDPANAGSGTAVCYQPASPSNAVMDHNIASDDTDSGTGSLGADDGIVTADLYVSTTGGSEDLRLKTGSDAIDVGTDLGTTPTGVNIDINGRDRDAQGDTWDIGAHEFVLVASFTFTPIKRKRMNYEILHDRS